MIHKMIKTFAPIAAIALSTALAGCDGVNIKINDEEGVPLSELDMSGDPPTELALIAPDKVILTEGDTLDITVEGDDEAVDAMRFTNSGGTLGIMRESGNWKGSSYATVRVTMPAPEGISIAGSGTVKASKLASDASINIAGSGSVEATEIDSDSLEISMGGSGKVSGAGKAERLEVSAAGSGNVDMPDLSVEGAEISIVGSGDVRFASDGDVEVSIAGSGNVYVTGSATCTVSAVGSGKVVCKSTKEEAAAEEEVTATKSAEKAKAKAAKANAKAKKKLAKAKKTAKKVRKA